MQGGQNQSCLQAQKEERWCGNLSRRLATYKWEVHKGRQEEVVEDGDMGIRLLPDLGDMHQNGTDFSNSFDISRNWSDNKRVEPTCRGQLFELRSPEIWWKHKPNTIQDKRRKARFFSKYEITTTTKGQSVLKGCCLLQKRTLKKSHNPCNSRSPHSPFIDLKKM